MASGRAGIAGAEGSPASAPGVCLPGRRDAQDCATSAPASDAATAGRRAGAIANRKARLLRQNRRFNGLAALAAAAACGALLVVSAGPVFAQSSTINKGSKSTLQKKGAAPAENAAGGDQNKAQKPKVIIKAKHGDWQIRCRQIKVPEAAAKKVEAQRGIKLPPAKNGFVMVENCVAAQAAVAKDRKNVGVMVNVLKGKQKKDDKTTTVTLFRVVAPMGVYLPTGVGLEVDGEAASRIPFARCLPSGCLADMGVSDALLGKLKKGKEAKVIVFAGPGEGIGLPLSLNGFTKAHSSL